MKINKLKVATTSLKLSRSDCLYIIYAKEANRDTKDMAINVRLPKRKLATKLIAKIAISINFVKIPKRFRLATTIAGIIEL